MRDLVADEPSGRVEHLADAEAAAVAEVADEGVVRAAVARRGRLEREQVRIGEVRDVDVVADARPVGRRVVVAEDRQGRLRPRRRARTFGIRWVSGSWSSPSASVAPATLK